MLAMAVAAFVGAFAAKAALEEIRHENRLIRYAVALVIGLVFTVVVGEAVQWVAQTFGLIAAR
jgi:hypothetical protein